MKKILLFFVFTVQIFGQMDFGQFNKIGFGDLYYLSIISGNSSLAGESYYILLKELGLTHLATYADTIALNNYGQGLKILDRNFERPEYVDTGGRNRYAFSFSFAMGNKFKVPYEVGGDTLGDLFTFCEENLWGFGTDEKSSLWQIHGNCKTGIQDHVDAGKKVAFASIDSTSHTVGTLVYIKTDAYHMPYSVLERSNTIFEFLYRAGLLMRVDKRYDIPDTAKILTIKVYEVRESPSTNSLDYSHWQIKNKEIQRQQDTLNTIFYVYNNQFSNSAYTEIITPYFFKALGSKSHIIVEVIWNRRCNVYIDKAYVFNQYYDSLFVETSVISQTQDSIRNSFVPNRDNPNYVHAYFDEPMPLQYYGQQKVSQLWETETTHQKYIKGADMITDNIDLELINFLHRPDRPKYILSDYYPLKNYISNSSTGSSSLQMALDSLVNVQLPRWPHDRYKGLRQMIRWAHNFKPDLSYTSDHIPFYHTIQCQGEILRDSTGNEPLHLRKPTREEIFAQGWLAICYGAKGLMYYDVHTETTYNPSSNDSGYYLYGLFNSKSYFPNSQGYLIYNAQVRQFPNERYDAVKELNRQIDEISSTLMDLTWYQGDSRHDSIPLTGTYITSVTAHTGIPPNFDPTSETFVELGLFKKTTSFSDSYLDYFMVVNRRCLESEGRNISVKINKSGTGFKNWKVTDIGRDTSYVILDTGSVSIYFEPGCGKLFRLEPVMIAGGTLAYNETVPQNTSFQVKGNVIVPSGKTLTINSGSNLTFIENGKLNIYGVLSITGSVNSKVTLDFTTPGNSRGLYLNPGSTAAINNAIIEEAYYGIFANGSSLVIRDSEVKDCEIGLCLYNTRYDTLGTEISGCNIHDNTYSGIYMNNASPLITNNTISGSIDGVRCIDNSDALLGKGGVEGYNYINNVLYGIYVFSSDPRLGSFDEKHQVEIGGYNSIVGENYNAWVEMYSGVIAHLNWWGSADPQPEEFLQLDEGIIDYNYYLDYSPFGESQTPEEGGEEILVKGKTGVITLESMTTKAKYEKAVIHYLNNRKAEARVYCNSILDEEGENRLKYPALRLLVRCMDEDSVRTNVIGKINNTLLTTAQTDYNAYLEMTLADIVKSNYITGLDGIMTKYRNTAYKPLILFRKFSYLYFEEGNKDSARVIADMMGDLYPEHELTKSAKMMFGETPLKKESAETSIIPKEYKLYQNYPNPFNPVTTIKYQLPLNSKVTLTIYDILGKEITKLVNEEQEAGKYQVTFDAKRYASGVYICRIIAGNFVKTIKMSMVK